MVVGGGERGMRRGETPGLAHQGPMMILWAKPTSRASSYNVNSLYADKTWCLKTGEAQRDHLCRGLSQLSAGPDIGLLYCITNTGYVQKKEL